MKTVLTFFCDLETTGLNKNCEKTQIAAITGEDCFDGYILPTQPINAGATQATGFSVINNVLCYKRKPVHPASLQIAMDWPRTVSTPNFTYLERCTRL